MLEKLKILKKKIKKKIKRKIKRKKRKQKIKFKNIKYKKRIFINKISININ